MVSLGKPAQRDKLLVLDMDETLIHAKFLDSEHEKHDGDFKVVI